MNPALYTRPNKPPRMVVTRRREAPAVALPALPEPLIVDSFTECHVTPLNAAARMVEYLDLDDGDYLVLEPEAGTGNIIQALRDSGQPLSSLVAVERHARLCSAIQSRFENDFPIVPVNACFLEYAEAVKGKIEYPRIIMNPPFSAVRKHMKAALSLLGFGGHDTATLIALVPMTYTHEDAKTIEELGRDTFSTAAVLSKIIRIEYRISRDNR